MRPKSYRLVQLASFRGHHAHNVTNGTKYSEMDAASTNNLKDVCMCVDLPTVVVSDSDSGLVRFDGEARNVANDS